MNTRLRAWPFVLALLAVAAPRHARAVLDIEDRGPVLRSGAYSLRVSNVGVLGNPWFDRGRSYDPSWEYPSGSGHELLGHAELWVGAIAADGQHRVSGGPMLEWRPSMAPDDRVGRVVAGDPRGRWRVDDDGDGRTDEDPPNGRDDDGDGRVDEDFDMPAQELFTAEYTDDTPEAIAFGYDGGEKHVPLGLSVHQECYGWTRHGLDGIAGISFTITNHGTETLRDLRVGFYVDLDTRERNSSGGHLDDRLLRVPYRRVTPKPESVINALGLWRKPCAEIVEGVAYAAAPAAGSVTTLGAVLPLSHTTDPLGWFTNDAFPGVAAARAKARAPRRDTTFRAYAFSPSLPPGQGGPPTLDRDRWAALAGEYPVLRDEGFTGDVAVLLSCGPFPTLAPGQSVECSYAFVAAGSLDSLVALAPVARDLQRGARFDFVANDRSNVWFAGTSGINGHETCVEPPAGVSFFYDPHCPQKIYADYTPDPLSQGPAISFEIPYRAGSCVWTDLDCDGCTGADGTDTARRWYLATLLPPPPTLRTRAGDGWARVEWDDWPEVALAGGLLGDPAITFAGYKLYRVSDWRRDALLPAPARWQRIAYFDEHGDNGHALATIRDDAAAIADSAVEFPHHVVGRYAYVDSTVHDGFDYGYVVTSVVRVHAPYDTLLATYSELESAFEPDFDARVVPHAAATHGGRVRVAPNPYRGSAAWDRPAVPGDVFTRHVDFLGLPRARCVVRIYTLAGDLVAEVPHDGTGGDGQASWNLISRNGQDVASGVYLFVVESGGTRETGRFVVIR
ncbi:MAG: hypothetical protein U0704_06315 [Candidatus Eisenbacteria bacterium]